MSLSADLGTSISLWRPADAEGRFLQASWAALAADRLAVRRDTAPAHFTASALPITPDGNRVCLVLHGRIGMWVQPGGHMETGDDSVVGAAAREMEEETGLSGEIAAEPVLLSRHRAPCGVDWHLDLQMLALVEEAAPVVSAESKDVAWFDVRHMPENTAPGVAELVEAGRRRL